MVQENASLQNFQAFLLSNIATFWNIDIVYVHMNRAMRKCVLCNMRTTKAQIRLRIRAVWPAPLLFAA